MNRPSHPEWQLNIGSVDRTDPNHPKLLPRFCDVCAVEPAEYGDKQGWFCLQCWLLKPALYPHRCALCSLPTREHYCDSCRATARTLQWQI